MIFLIVHKKFSLQVLIITDKTFGIPFPYFLAYPEFEFEFLSH